MTVIQSAFIDLHAGEPSTFQNLTVFPLIGGSDPEPFYDTLDAALHRETLRITEVTDAGHVPEVKVLNGGQRPVLIIDGEELVGAKQNRTVNLSILVPANADLVVPVTCVEAGRWHSRSGGFETSSRTHFAEGRAAKSRQVTESLLACGVPTADQSQVWDAIALKSTRLQASSRTSAMADIFEQQSTRVEDYLHAIRLQDGQVGAMFLIGDEVRGADIFDSSKTLRAVLPKLVRGYALDAIDHARVDTELPSGTSADDARRREAVRRFLGDASESETKLFETVGLGQSSRLLGTRISGGALMAQNRIVHLSAFRG